MKILVTGGAGFIGSHLIDKLIEENHKVICIDNLSLGREENIIHNFENKNFKFIKHDLLDLPGLKKIFQDDKPDHVFHFAANSDIKQSLTNTSLDLKQNFLTTYNVLECMRLFDVKNIVFSSTSAIYGKSDSLLSEDYGPLFPISLYGASKLAAEAYISAYSDNHNIKAWIIRFPNVIGERITHGILFDLINKLRKDSTQLEVLGDGKQTKPYVYVKDLIDAILLIWESSKDRLNYFNVSCDTSTSVSEIVDIILEGIGLKNVKINYTGGKIGWIGDVNFFKYNSSKIRKLGWKEKYSSDEAVKLAVKEIIKNESNNTRRG
ncbi:MAG: NAD-dependent epimerase/dehydratase family protein [Nanoarchaeota archaeon]|nr:NAD-dependent epimerase/dehydratase family protein [Nanoarchaeota archaeon]